MHSLVVCIILFGVYIKFIFTKLKRTEAATNQIFNTAAHGMRVVDKDFNVLRINDTFSTMVGISKDESANKKCYEVFFSHLCHTPNCLLTRILDGEKSVECEIEKERNDGTRIPCIVTATPFRSSDGELIGIVEDFKDITKLKLAEAEIRKEKIFSENIVATVPDSLLVVDKDLRIKSANRTFYETFKTEPRKVIGTRITEILPDKDEKLCTGLTKLFGTKDMLENFELHCQSEKLGERV
ncbi:MAG: PAS domain-containing protein, partial [Candidatus Aerophobetes bacterium]|nr:PAS domain-containing protein [Candidatus Aerophobetes bacterium]